MTVRRSYLHDEHLALGATMRTEDGWTMPLSFRGVFAEYQAHRRRAVVWDASDLGAIEVTGPAAFELLQRTLTNDLRRVRPGRSQYTFLLAERDGSVVDDLMLWWVREESFLLMPNRPAAVLAALAAAAAGRPAGSCELTDAGDRRVLLAVQGARAAQALASIVPEAASLRPFEVRTRPDGDGYVAGTRFGGRPGFELYLARETGRAVYRRLIADGVTPAGLGMRETCRLESGLPRHGFELVPRTTPLQIGSEHAVCFDKQFAGRAALLDQRRRGPGRVLRAVVMSGRRAPATGSPLACQGVPVGQVTSSNFSPRLHRALALAFVDPGLALGAEVVARSAGTDLPGTLAAATAPVRSEP